MDFRLLKNQAELFAQLKMEHLAEQRAMGVRAARRDFRREPPPTIHIKEEERIPTFERWNAQRNFAARPYSWMDCGPPKFSRDNVVDAKNRRA